MADHAILSASGAPGWMRCQGKLFAEKLVGTPDTSSVHADEGTAAHELAQLCLEQKQDASAFVGRIITVGERKFEVDEDMAEAVQVYVDIVRGLGGDLMIEQKVDYTRYVLDHPEPGMTAYGTSDALIVLEDELIVVDYKHGKGVRVDATENEQLQLYALGCYDIASLIYDIKRVRLMIVQPRANNISEWALSVEELMDFGLRAKIAARHAAHQYAGKAEPKFTPGEKQCRWCKAKAQCPALMGEVLDFTSVATVEEFIPLGFEEAVAALKVKAPEQVAVLMSKVDMIEGLCKAVRAATESYLLAGTEVDGFKLVEGKRGNRAWANADEAELQLKTMRLKVEEMYDLKLISPTTAEKLRKAGAIGPRQWSKVEALITQSEGKPSVAPASDKRPAINPAVSAADFAPIDDVGDLV